MSELKHTHYYKNVTRYDQIDIYRVLELFGVESPSIGHAIKKLLMAGDRGNKGYFQDLMEAQDSIIRAIGMAVEDGRIEEIELKPLEK